MKQQARRARRQRVADTLGLPVKRDRKRARQTARVSAFFRAYTRDSKARRLKNLCDQNTTQLLVGLDHQKAVWRLKLEPVFDTRLDLFDREATLARELKKGLDQLIQLVPGVRGGLRVRTRAHIDAAPLTKLDPAAPRQLAIRGADGI